MKDKNIVRYARNNLPKGKTNWDTIKNLPEEELENAAKNDFENPRWTKEMLDSASLQMPQKKCLFICTLTKMLSIGLDQKEGAIKRASTLFLSPTFISTSKSTLNLSFNLSLNNA